MSKEFTILNLLTFDGVKYMENSDLYSRCLGRFTFKQMSSPPRKRPSHHPGPLCTSKRRRWICFMTRTFWMLLRSSRRSEKLEIRTYVAQAQALVSDFSESNTPSVPSEASYASDYSPFNFNEQPCKNIDVMVIMSQTHQTQHALHSLGTKTPCSHSFNARDTIARSLSHRLSWRA